LPCRIQDPNRKGKVESGIGHAQRTYGPQPRIEIRIGLSVTASRWGQEKRFSYWT
jgi:hypothetical protein